MLLVLAVTAQAADEWRSQYERGLEILGDRRSAEAAEDLERLLAEAIGHLKSALAEAQTLEDRAEIELILGGALSFSGQHEAAIAAYRRVLAHDPQFRRDYPTARVYGANPQVMLGHAYEQLRQLDEAMYWWEEYLSWSQSHGRIPAMIASARRTLAADGELRASPVVMTFGRRLIPSRPVGEAQRLLVPAAKLAEALRLECEASDDHETVTVSREGGVAMTLRAGSRTAVVDGAETEMEVAPQLIEEELWVPLRFVVEAFGHRIEWEAPARIAWVRWQ
ncbi:MAG: stalk domain-containing protein [Armatimonadota bacterium]